MNRAEINMRAAIATKWSAITEIATKCVTPITNMVLARLLTPETFGVVATVTMIVSFADMFADAGFQKYLMQHDFSDRRELDENTNVAFWTNMAISVFFWIAISIFSEPLAALVGNPGLGNVVIIATLSLPFTSFSSIQMARFKRDFDFKSLFYIRLILALVPFVVTVPLAFLTRSYWALIIGTLTNNLIQAIVLTVRSSWKPKLYFKFSILKEMFSYSWWILLESIANWLTSYIGTFVVGMFLTTYYVGLYKTSMSTVNQVIQLIAASTSAPLFVALSKLKNDHKSLMETYYSFIHGLCMFLFPLGVGIWLYKDLVTSILLGKQWMEAANFVGLWGLMSTVTLALGTYCNGLYNAVGKTKLSFLSQILHIVVLIPVLLWSAPLGFEKLYIARSLVRLQMVAVQLVIMKLCMKASLIQLIKGMFPAVICTVIMAAVSVALNYIGQSFMWQICSVAICIVVYFATCLIFCRRQLFSALAIFGINLSKQSKKIE